jgi:drug/metabolite transporter (DMT)-like permease
MTISSPVLRGGLLALLAAALFGLSTPLVQRFGLGLGPFSTAVLLYGGAALVALFQRRGAAVEAPLRRSDVPRLLAMVGAAAVVGPVALAWGLQRTSGASALAMQLNPNQPRSPSSNLQPGLPLLIGTSTGGRSID